MTHTLWSSHSASEWAASLERYAAAVDALQVKPLSGLDRWYHHDLPGLITSRAEPHITHEELVKLTEWKMARGVWRARNLVLVRGNDAALVVETSTKALALVPHATKPIATLAELAGVGPATASAVAAAFAPETYPFFDEVVAKQIPTLGPVVFTMPYYAKYAQAIRDRAASLGGSWTPASVERALWANYGN